MIIFGYQTRPKLIGRVLHSCKHCKHKTPHALIKVTYWFDLFFIPIIPFSSQAYNICEECNFRTKLSKDESRKLVALLEKPIRRISR